MLCCYAAAVLALVVVKAVVVLKSAVEWPVVKVRYVAHTTQNYASVQKIFK